MTAERHVFVHSIEAIERDGGKFRGKIPAPFRAVSDPITYIYHDRVEMHILLEIDPKKLKPDAKLDDLC